METQSKSESLFQVSEIQVSYRTGFRAADRPKILGSESAYEILFNNWDLGKIELQEQFKVVLLNRSNRVIGIYEVSSGGMAGTLADPKLIFGAALKSCASGIILCHNHPSGNLKPSQADINLTRKLKTAGNFLDIEVHDHLIITNDGYYSFADNRMI
jgi:DNA repair protein RadC